MEQSRNGRRQQASARRWLAVATLAARATLGVARRAGAQAVVGCAADPATRAAELVAAVANAVGAGPRSIALASGCVYTLHAPASDGSGLPVVASGAQESALTIAGNGATIERADDAPSFRFFAVAAGNSLTLNDLTLRGGAAPDGPQPEDGGAIRSEGQLVLHRCTLTANRAGADCDAAYGGNGGAVAILDGSAEVDDAVRVWT